LHVPTPSLHGMSGVLSGGLSTSLRHSNTSSASSASTRHSPISHSSSSDDNDEDLATLSAELANDPSAVVSVPAQKLRKLKEDAELKRKRLDRKAELARNSRRKKKQRVVELEEQVAVLQAQLADSMGRTKDLESHCQLLSMQAQDANMQLEVANSAANDAIQQAQVEAAAAVAAAAVSPPSVTSASSCTSCSTIEEKGAKIIFPGDVRGLTESVAQLNARGADVTITEALQALSGLGLASSPKSSKTGSSEAATNSVDQLMIAIGDVTALTKASLDLIDRILAPSMPVRVLRWAMSQSDKFYADSNGLWISLLQQDCGVTPQQMLQLDELRANFKIDASQQATSLAFITEQASSGPLDMSQVLRQVLVESRRQLIQNETCFTQFRAILSADQMVKYLSWVERYGNVVVRINV